MGEAVDLIPCQQIVGRLKDQLHVTIHIRRKRNHVTRTNRIIGGADNSVSYVIFGTSKSWLDFARAYNDGPFRNVTVGTHRIGKAKIGRVKTHNLPTWKGNI